MLSAVWLLYAIARKLFNGNRSAAFATVIVFCTHPITIFEAIDARPYAFTALAICLSIWLLLRLRHSTSPWLAALFGASAALAAWFHYLAVTLAPALLIVFFVFKWEDRRNLWRQFAAALASFTLTFLPLIPGILYLLHTSQTHNLKIATTYRELTLTVFPILLDVVLLWLVLVALILDTFATIRSDQDDPKFGVRPLAVAALLGLIPLLFLFTVSRWTGLNCFSSRYRLIALPGIALCFGWAIGRLRPYVLRLVFCFVLGAITASVHFFFPSFHKHYGTWKYAIQVVEAKAAPTQSPVLMCSGYSESDFWPLPSGPANNTLLLAPLSYNRLTVPAYVLPMELNAKAKQIGSAFISRAAENHQSFFAACVALDYPNSPTLNWLSRRAAADFSVTTVGTYDLVRVLEFTPRPTTPPFQKRAPNR